ncbi:MAG: hypothetical protein DHS20C09_12500 [marine bacterium B5-7]|nr:MAG: hypothetical protein DHS20C09_12500 [marine bacterium B5-7]
MKLIQGNEPAQPWFKEYYVWLIIFFPLLAIIGGIITSIIAIKSDDGLVVDDYYKQGLEINRTLERDRAASNYQLDADINIINKQDIILIELKAGSNFKFPPGIRVSFLNATRSGLDKTINLLLTENNVYRGDLSKLSPGKWYAHIEYNDWRLTKEIIIYE